MGRLNVGREARRFPVCGADVGLLAFFDEGNQRASVEIIGWVDFQYIQGRGKNVDGASQSGDPFPALKPVGSPDDQGNPHGGVVDKVAMRGFAVFVQAFAVVRGEHDDGTFVQTKIRQAPEESANLCIRIGHFGMVGALRESISEKISVGGRGYAHRNSGATERRALLYIFS